MNATHDHETEIRRFGIALLGVLLGSAALFLIVGGVVSMIAH
jgi:hypothetical protein